METVLGLDGFIYIDLSKFVVQMLKHGNKRTVVGCSSNVTVDISHVE